MKTSTSNSTGNRQPATGNVAAFTMIGIALCLAIIGFALLAIIIVLPYGMGTQRDNRQETLIGQDANLLINLIRSGSRGSDDLTNYVYAITFSRTIYSSSNTISGPPQYYYLTNMPPGYPATPSGYLTSGRRIIGLMSMPEFTDVNGRPIPDLYIYNGGISNHVVAYVRSISGLAAEKPPQDNDIMRGDSFAYQLICLNAVPPVDHNLYNLPSSQRAYMTQLGGAQHEMRLKFRWPQRPNGSPENVGNSYGNNQVFRMAIAGQLSAVTNDNNLLLYFHQPQSFSTQP